MVSKIFILGADRNTLFGVEEVIEVIFYGSYPGMLENTCREAGRLNEVVRIDAVHAGACDACACMRRMRMRRRWRMRMRAALLAKGERIRHANKIFRKFPLGSRLNMKYIE